MDTVKRFEADERRRLADMRAFESEALSKIAWIARHADELRARRLGLDFAGEGVISTPAGRVYVYRIGPTECRQSLETLPTPKRLGLFKTARAKAFASIRPNKGPGQ